MIARYTELLTAGWTPGRIRSAVARGGLLRLQPGIYTNETPPDLAVRARGALLDNDAVVSHGAAAHLLGFAEAPDTLHLTVGHTSPLRPGPGLALHRSTRRPPWQDLDGIRVTTPYRTVLDLARALPFAAGVELVDAALHAGVVNRAELLAREPLLHHLPGARRARRTLAACREGSQSPMETRTRLLLVGGGLPEPALQHPIVTAIALLHVDLAWPSHRVCVEYDGVAAHLDRFAPDRVRWRALVAAGWDVRPVTSVDLRRPATLLREIGAALSVTRSPGGRLS